MKNLFLLFVSVIVLGALAGCGTSEDQPTPSPAGAFNNSSLNGTYILSFSGYDTSSGYGSYFSMLGSISADGNGTLTSGTIDLNDPALGSALNTHYALTHLPATGNYSITPDGRGTGNIAVSVNGAQVRLGIDFVLSSNSHGMISRFDSSGSGSGAIDIAGADLTQSSLAGSYAFGFGGVDATAANPLMTAGAFTLDSSGNISAGVQDFNDNGNSRGARALSMNGTVLVGAPGTSQLTTEAFGFGTLHFDVWAIDATHLKFIETDSVSFMAGDAITSTGHTSLPSGKLVSLSQAKMCRRSPLPLEASCRPTERVASVQGPKTSTIRDSSRRPPA